MDSASPALILVRPQLGENIGAVARAMRNFGLNGLRLVSPRDGWPNAKAYEMATGDAKSVLDAAEIYQSVSAALHDIHRAYATTARVREMDKQMLAPSEAALRCSQYIQLGERAAFVFGPERSGLSNEDLMLCDALVCIPTAGANASLNLAQSAVIMAYEWAQCRQREAPMPLTATPEAPPAAKSEWEGLFRQVEEALDHCGYFRTPQKKPLMWQNLRNILTRSSLSSQEIKTLRGMFRSLARLDKE